MNETCRIRVEMIFMCWKFRLCCLPLSQENWGWSRDAELKINYLYLLPFSGRKEGLSMHDCGICILETYCLQSPPTPSCHNRSVQLLIDPFSLTYPRFFTRLQQEKRSAVNFILDPECKAAIASREGRTKYRTKVWKVSEWMLSYLSLKESQ